VLTIQGKFTTAHHRPVLNSPHQRIFILRGKFEKDRFILLHTSVLPCIDPCLGVRSLWASQADFSPLSLNRNGQCLSNASARNALN